VIGGPPDPAQVHVKSIGLPPQMAREENACQRRRSRPSKASTARHSGHDATIRSLLPVRQGEYRHAMSHAGPILTMGEIRLIR